jgi:hypothetical protein
MPVKPSSPDLQSPQHNCRQLCVCHTSNQHQTAAHQLFEAALCSCSVPTFQQQHTLCSTVVHTGAVSPAPLDPATSPAMTSCLDSAFGALPTPCCSTHSTPNAHSVRAWTIPNLCFLSVVAPTRRSDNSWAYRQLSLQQQQQQQQQQQRRCPSSRS